MSKFHRFSDYEKQFVFSGNKSQMRLVPNFPYLNLTLTLSDRFKKKNDIVVLYIYIYIYTTSLVYIYSKDGSEPGLGELRVAQHGW